MEETEAESAAIEAQNESAESTDDSVDVESGDPAAAGRAQQFGKESAATNAALAFLKAAKANKPEPDDDDLDISQETSDDATEEAPATSIPAKVEPPKVDPPAALDPKSEILLARLTASEANTRSLQAEMKELRAQAARAERLEKAAAAMEAGDAAPLFEMFKWSPDTVLRFAEGGKEGIAGDVLKRSVEQTQAELKAVKDELSRERATREVETYKGSLSREIAAVSADVPYLVKYHSDPTTGVFDAAAATEAVFHFQFQMHQAGREVSVPEAITALNKGHEQLFERLGGKKQDATNTADTAAGKQTVTPPKKQVVVVEKPRVKLPPKAPRDREAEAREQALALLRAGRAAMKANAQAEDE